MRGTADCKCLARYRSLINCTLLLVLDGNTMANLPIRSSYSGYQPSPLHGCRHFCAAEAPLGQGSCERRSKRGIVPSSSCRLNLWSLQSEEGTLTVYTPGKAFKTAVWWVRVPRGSSNVTGDLHLVVAPFFSTVVLNNVDTDVARRNATALRRPDVHPTQSRRGGVVRE